MGSFAQSFTDPGRNKFIRTAYEQVLRQAAKDFTGARTFFGNLSANSQGLLNVDFNPATIGTKNSPYILEMAEGTVADDKTRPLIESAIDGAVGGSDTYSYSDTREMLNSSPILSQLMAWHEANPTPASTRILGKGALAEVKQSLSYHGFDELSSEQEKVVKTEKFMRVMNDARKDGVGIPSILLDGGRTKSGWSMYAPAVASLMDENSDLEQDELTELVREEITGKYPTATGLMSAEDIVHNMRPYLYAEDATGGNGGVLTPIPNSDLGNLYYSTTGVTRRQEIVANLGERSWVGELAGLFSHMQIIRREGKTLFAPINTDTGLPWVVNNNAVFFSASEEAE